MKGFVPHKEEVKKGSGSGNPGGGANVFDFYAGLFEADGPKEKAAQQQASQQAAAAHRPASGVWEEQKEAEGHGIASDDDDDDDADDCCAVADASHGGIAAILDRTKPSAHPRRSRPPPESMSKGLRMLKNLGWKEGTGLGASRQGVMEPVGAVLKKDKKGVGKGQAPLAPKSLLSATTMGKRAALEDDGRPNFAGMPKSKRAMKEEAARDRQRRNLLHEELNFSSNHHIP